MTYLQYLTRRPRGFFVPTATRGVVEGEEPAGFVKVRFADDVAASVIQFRKNELRGLGGVSSESGNQKEISRIMINEGEGGRMV